MTHVTAVSPRGLAWLAALEGGARLDAYLDSGGVWTIGVGMIRWPRPWESPYELAGREGTRVVEGDTLSDLAMAMEFYRATLRRYEDTVDAVTRDDLEQHQFDALVALAYNIGESGFRTSTAVKRVNARASSVSIATAWGWWHYDDGQPVAGLITRRKREIEAFEGGEYRDQHGVVIRALYT